MLQPTSPDPKPFISPPTSALLLTLGAVFGAHGAFGALGALLYNWSARRITSFWLPHFVGRDYERSSAPNALKTPSAQQRIPRVPRSNPRHQTLKAHQKSERVECKLSARTAKEHAPTAAERYKYIYEAFKVHPALQVLQGHLVCKVERYTKSPPT